MADNFPTLPTFNPFNDGTTGSVTGYHMRYPRDLTQPPFDKWILFEAKAGRHVLRNQIVPEKVIGDGTLQSVSLYMSETALRSSLNVVYDKNELGPFVGAAVELFAQTGKNIFDSNIMGENGLVNNLKSALTELASRVSGASAGDLGETFLDMIKTDAARGIASLVGGSLTGGALTGTKINPRTDVLFNTQEFRTHNMQFLMVPRNREEAISIDRIIHFFQFYMLPNYHSNDLTDNLKIGGFLMGFPYEFEISLFNGLSEMQHVNKIGRSVLTSIEVDHAAGGKTAFIKDNGEYFPVATRIGLNFMEVRLLARDSPEIRRADGLQLPDPRSGVR